MWLIRLTDDSCATPTDVWFDGQKVSRSHVSDLLWEAQQNPVVNVSDCGSVCRSERWKTVEDELMDHWVTRGHADHLKSPRTLSNL